MVIMKPRAMPMKNLDVNKWFTSEVNIVHKIMKTQNTNEVISVYFLPKLSMKGKEIIAPNISPKYKMEIYFMVSMDSLSFALL